MGKKLGLAPRCLYNDKGLCAGMGLLVLPLAGKSHHFPGWSRRTTPPQRDLALTTHTQSCTPDAPLCTPLRSWLLLCLEKDPSGSKEQSRVILPWPLISITGEGGSSLYPALEGAQGHQGKCVRPAWDYTETQGRCLLILSPPSCTFPFSIYSSPSILQKDHPLPRVGEATQRIGNKGVHLPFLPTHHLHLHPH